jgi:hypothetical protein
MSTLQHLEQATPDNDHAESVRVTAEELAQALAAVETRRADEQQRTADTIALGEAIRQLDLDVTPEELLAEVSIRRREVQQSANRKVRQRENNLVLVMVLVVSFAVNILLVTRQPRGQQPSVVAAATITPTPQLADFPKLSQVPDGLTVFVDFDTLSALAKGRAADSVVVDARQNVGSRQLWRIVKQPNGLFVQAFVSEADALKIANGQAGQLSATDPTWGGTQSYALTDVPLARFANIVHTSSVTEPDGTYFVSGVKLGTVKMRR